MKNYIDNILFAALIAVISLGGVALYFINKSDAPKLSTASASSNTYTYKHPSIIANTDLNPSAVANNRNYEMLEPFASNSPFDFTNAMQQPMNPAVWMQMMTSMMNTMQMTQMMHQMAAMPSQMMNPTMWMNPHGMSPNGTANPSQQPMDPKEYKKWYEQQLELQQSTN